MGRVGLNSFGSISVFVVIVSERLGLLFMFVMGL